MFLPNLDGDTVDVPGRRKDGRGGSGRGRRTAAAGLLALGGWCTGRASCLFSSFGRHFLKEGVWSWFCFRTQFLMILQVAANVGEDEGAWVALNGSKSRRKRSCLVYSFINHRRRHHLQLRV